MLALGTFGGCAGAANVRTCDAYEAARDTAVAACHWACDRVPERCPWRAELGE